MTELSRAEKVDRYFMRRPTRRDPLLTALVAAAGLAAVPVLLLLAEGHILLIRLVLGLVALGFGLLAGAGVVTLILDELAYRRAYADAFPRGSDQEMDEWVDEAVGRAIKNGLERLDLHPDEIQAGGPTTLWFVGVPNLEEWDAGVARGEDGRLRFSVRPVLVAFLNGWRLSTYEFVLSLRSGYFFNEVRKEYHLRQTDGIEMITHTLFSVVEVSVHGPRRLGRSQPKFEIANVTSVERLELVVSGQRAIKLDMRFRLQDHPDGNLSPRSRNDEFVALLRDHFRHHMGGVPVEPREPSPPPHDVRAGTTLPTLGTALDRTPAAIVERLRLQSSDQSPVAAALITPEGDELRISDGLNAGTITLFERQGADYDELLSLKAEANAVAIVEAEGIEVATLVVVGRVLVDAATREKLQSLLGDGRQLHLYEGERPVASLFGGSPKVAEHAP